MMEDYMEYEVDFSKITMGDIASYTRRDADIRDHLAFSDKVIIGGIKDIPANEILDVFRYVANEYGEWVNRIVGKDPLTEMLEDVEM